MKTKSPPPAGTTVAPLRKHRRRTLPRWLVKTADLDAIARSRCLLVLSVLSGEKPVTDAIVHARLSRPGYYALETRALQAMLAALNPLTGASQDGRTDLTLASRRIKDLERKVAILEQDKRRAERLLLLTRKTLTRGPSPKLLTSIPPPPKRWLRSKAKAAANAPSTPTPAGASAS